MASPLRYFYYKLPVKLRYIVRRVIYFPADMFTNKNVLQPPKGKIYTGSGNFVEIGNEFFSYFKKYGEITPNSSILDIGSGIGRMAIPFTKFLNHSGSYRGFDIVKQGVNWCTKNISSRYPNFVFLHINLKNDLYNASTKIKPSNFNFPYKNDEFDFVFLTSVFTHMLPNDISQYLTEINRVIKSNKKCLATFFILDETSKALMINSDKYFKYQKENYALMSEKVKEANVAYNKLFLFELIKEKGFEVESYHQGSWSGKTENALSYQDILILKKKQNVHYT